MRARWAATAAASITLMLLAAAPAAAAPSDLDPSFGEGGEQVVDSISGGQLVCCRSALYPGGKIVVAAGVSGSTTVKVARFNDDGSLDTSFDPHGVTPGIAPVTFDGAAGVVGIAVDSQARIVVAARVANGASVEVGVARLTASGALDASFNRTGIAESSLGHVDGVPGGIAIMPDDRIVVAAYVDDGSSNRQLLAARFGADGVRDAGFGTPFVAPGGGQIDPPLIAADGQGRLILAADLGNQQLIARLDATGKLDQTFDPTGNPPGTVVTSFAPAATAEAVAVTSDGRPVIAGLQFTSGPGEPIVERFTAAGALDPSFGSGGIAMFPGLAGAFEALARQNDGSWIVAGQSSAEFLVGRLTEDGMPDTGFSASGTVTTELNGTGASSASSVSVDGAGRILAIGDGSAGSQTELAMARYAGGPGVGAPTVGGESVLQAGSTSATVVANINPEGTATHYHVEWGTTASYGFRGPTLPGSGALAGGTEQSAGAQLTGLSPATTYHWRIVASSSSGTTAGADQTVTTQALTPPPPGGSGGPPAGSTGAPPTAVIHAITPQLSSGQRGEFSGAGSVIGSAQVINYAWDWNGDGHYDASCPGSNPIALHDFLISGTYHVGLQVTDASGQSSTTTTTINVSPGATTVPPGTVGAFACASTVNGILCVHHIQWELIVADTLDGGCFEQAPTIPLTAHCVVCALSADGEPAVQVPQVLADELRAENAKTWVARGRVLVNGMIIDPLFHRFGSGAQAGFVLVDELDDAIYSSFANAAIKAPAAGGLPDTPIGQGVQIFARLPRSVPPPAFRSAFRRMAHVAADGANPCDASLPTLASFPDPAQAGLNASIDQFPLAGGPVTVHVVNGQIVVCVDLTLPALAPCPGDDAGGFKLKATLLADQDGLELQSLRARLPCAVIAGVVFSGVFFNYESNGHHWVAGGTVEAIPGIPLHGVVEFSHGQFVHAGASLDTDALVTPPIQVTSAGIDVYPDHTTGDVGLGLYPIVPGIHKSLLDISGHYDLNWQAEPPYFRLTGSADSFGIPLANGALTVYPDHVNLVGHVEANFFDAFTATADLKGDLWHLSPLRFNIDATATLSVFDLVDFGGQLLVSDNGAAACVEIKRNFGLLHFHLHIGAAINWDPFGIDAMFTGCDVGRERDAGAPARDVRGVAAVRAGVSVPVAKGTNYEIFGIDGAGAPPPVELRGPRGETLRANARGPSLNRRYAVLHDAERKTTFVIVAKPSAGMWRVAALPGSTAITAVHYAASLPPVSVKASVHGKGRRRTLSYRVAAIPGQVVRFLERGRGALRSLGTVRGGGSGTLRFSPASGPGGRREIDAVVFQYGHPRTELTVARYIAPPLPRLTRPAPLRAVRSRSSLRFSWRRVLGAGAYLITVSSSDHRHVTTVIAAHRFTLLNVPASVSVTFTVRAISSHAHGPSSSIRVRAVTPTCKRPAHATCGR